MTESQLRGGPDDDLTGRNREGNDPVESAGSPPPSSMSAQLKHSISCGCAYLRTDPPQWITTCLEHAELMRERRFPWTSRQTIDSTAAHYDRLAGLVNHIFNIERKLNEVRHLVTLYDAGHQDFGEALHNFWTTARRLLEGR